MNDTEFQRLADVTLEKFAKLLEDADANGLLELELMQGVLTLSLPENKTIVISKHSASKQIWVSSPLSGGTHFSYIENAWVLADGRDLELMLRQELHQLVGVELA